MAVRASLVFLMGFLPIILCLCLAAAQARTRYEPTWASLDTRPLPAWYDEAKFGIFMHWGVFSVPSDGNEWFWKSWHDGHREQVNFMKANYPPDFTYADFAPLFRAEFFDPNEWADILQASGANYVVLTSKHHEGFTLWPSSVSWNWNAMDVGPHRDLVGELAAAVRKRTKLHFGLYHSLFEWFHPLWLEDQANKFATHKFPTAKTMPELHEIVTAYKPEVVWSDGDWLATAEYWNSTSFLAWLYNDSPVRDTVVVNDRWGKYTRCKHGDFINCADKFMPDKLMGKKWERCMTVDAHSWGYDRRSQLHDYLTLHTLLDNLAHTVSYGGNLLLNVGPTADGRILPLFEERLRGMGSWLRTNGEAIYKTHAWANQTDTHAQRVWYTAREDAVYAIVMTWPDSGHLELGAPRAAQGVTKVQMLGVAGMLPWQCLTGQATQATTQATACQGVSVDLSRIPVNKLPSTDAWVVKLTHLAQ